MRLFTTWGRDQTISQLRSIVTRNYTAARKLGELQAIVDRTGIPLLNGWNFRKSSMKAYKVANSARDTYNLILQGHTHIYARFFTHQCESMLSKIERVIDEAERECLMRGLNEGSRHA